MVSITTEECHCYVEKVAETHGRNDVYHCDKLPPVVILVLHLIGIECLVTLILCTTTFRSLHYIVCSCYIYAMAFYFLYYFAQLF